MKRIPIALLALLFVAAAPAKLEVSDAWIRESNPARNITSAFVTLRNPTGKAIVVVGVSAPVAKVVEMHEMKTIDGVMSMRRVDTIVVPARSSIKLEPGGMHLMLIDLVSRAKAGTVLPITFRINDGSSITVNAPVKNPDQQHAH